MQQNNSKFISSHEDLEVYKIAFDAAMEIFKISKNFPKEEKYSLIDQIRRSYLEVDSGRKHYSQYNQILGLIVIMTNSADKWLLKKN